MCVGCHSESERVLEQYHLVPVPKNRFGSRITVEIAVYLAVIIFNHGMEGFSPVFKNLFGSSPHGFTAGYIASGDSKRIKKSLCRRLSIQARNVES